MITVTATNQRQGRCTTGQEIPREGEWQISLEDALSAIAGAYHNYRGERWTTRVVVEEDQLAIHRTNVYWKVCELYVASGDERRQMIECANRAVRSVSGRRSTTFSAAGATSGSATN